MDSYKITFDTWNKIAKLYQDNFMDLDLYNDTYDLFCNLIEKQNPKIFEIGCGPGNITKYLLLKRPDFKIDAIDVAPNMIQLAQHTNPTANFNSMDCREIDKITATYDAIMCGFCMPYLAEQDCNKLVNDCSALLNYNGVFYFSVIEGDYFNSGYEFGSSGDKCYVYYYNEDFFKKLLLQTHFELKNVIRINYTKSDNTTNTHLIFIAKKNKF